MQYLQINNMQTYIYLQLITLNVPLQIGKGKTGVRVPQFGNLWTEAIAARESKLGQNGNLCPRVTEAIHKIRTESWNTHTVAGRETRGLTQGESLAEDGPLTKTQKKKLRNDSELLDVVDVYTS